MSARNICNYQAWLQCGKCAWLCPIYEAKYEQSLQGFAQPTDNPFDEEKGQVLGVCKRSSKEGKKALDKLERTE